MVNLRDAAGAVAVLMVSLLLSASVAGVPAGALFDAVTGGVTPVDGGEPVNRYTVTAQACVETGTFGGLQFGSRTGDGTRVEVEQQDGLRFASIAGGVSPQSLFTRQNVTVEIRLDGETVNGDAFQPPAFSKTFDLSVFAGQCLEPTEWRNVPSGTYDVEFLFINEQGETADSDIERVNLR